MAWNEAGNFLARGPGRVDPRLRAILSGAAANSPFRVEAFSGYRPGDPRFHGKGLATDVRLFDDRGRAIPNYQNAAAFRQYEQYAQAARQLQMQKFPELAKQFRWGGYFSGPPGKYGAADLMHFDLGGSDHLGMAGGSWADGLNAQQRRYFGNASRGLGPGSSPGGMIGNVPRSPGAQDAATFPGFDIFGGRAPMANAEIGTSAFSDLGFASLLGQFARGQNPIKQAVYGGLAKLLS